MTNKLNAHVEDELFNKEKRVTPTPPKQEPRIIKEGEQPIPVKKKKPYYRKKINKPKPVEVVPEPEKKYTFLKGLLIGFGVGLVIGLIVKSIL
jgi:hypothetical protein